MENINIEELEKKYLEQMIPINKKLREERTFIYQYSNNNSKKNEAGILASKNLKNIKCLNKDEIALIKEYSQYISENYLRRINIIGETLSLIYKSLDNEKIIIYNNKISKILKDNEILQNSFIFLVLFSVHLPITEKLLDRIKPLHQFIKINDYNKEAVFDNLTYFSFNSRMLSAINYFFKKNIIELKLYLELSKETENDLIYNIIDNDLHSDLLQQILAIMISTIMK